MSTNFPTALDSLTNPTGGQTLGAGGHAAQHGAENDAIEALEAKVGVNNSTDPASLDYRVAQVEAGKEPAITAGTTSQYRRGDKTWVDFATDVRAAVLTGLSTTTNAAISATDTVLVAIGKLQAQIAGIANATMTLINKTLSNPTITNYTETYYAPAAGTAFTVDLANGTVQRFTSSGNITITLPTSATGKSYVIEIAYSGAHTVTFSGGSTIKWSAATAPTATSVSGKIDRYVFECDGTNTLGADGGRNF